MKNIWERWKKIAEKIGNFQANVIFSFLYFIVVTPMGWLTKNKDFLQTKYFPRWIETEDNYSSLKKLKQQ